MGGQINHVIVQNNSVIHVFASNIPLNQQQNVYCYKKELLNVRREYMNTPKTEAQYSLCIPSFQLLAFCNFDKDLKCLFAERAMVVINYKSPPTLHKPGMLRLWLPYRIKKLFLCYS